MFLLHYGTALGHINISCVVEALSVGYIPHYPSSVVLPFPCNFLHSPSLPSTGMLPSQRHGMQRPHQPRQGRPSAGHATTAPAPAPAPAPATAPKTVALSATQLQPQNQPPLSFQMFPTSSTTRKASAWAPSACRHRRSLHIQSVLCTENEDRRATPKNCCTR